MNQVAPTETTFAAPRLPVETPSIGAEKPLAPAAALAGDSLFERLAWLYVFFREQIFRDDTGRFIRALWPEGAPAAGTRLIELGCGPGYYSCGLAVRFPRVSVLGVDCSERQLEWARTKARAMKLRNCSFQSENVLGLSHEDESFDALIAARLFTILPDQRRAITEMYRVLKPGGRCIIAEPRYQLWASLPLLAMWLLAGIIGRDNGCREPRKAIVLSSEEFQSLFASQPWREIKTWQDGRYQYALCEKG